ELNDLTDQFVKRMNAYKLEIIISKLEEKNIKIDWEFERDARFKSIYGEVEGFKETYYYNDSSKEGLRIVTFEMEDWMKKPITTIGEGDKIELKMKKNFK